ncbi:glycoside hydrolase family 19 protein [Roseovarius sp.]|uniref:glycoside hydrolase family 19 protein n=1 Tax=Roseovarius sp. TaxID=1486281 RepID=UPI003BACD024
MTDMRLGDTQLIVEECQKQGLLRNQAAYVLATAYWETARTMEPVREAFWLSEGWRQRNLRYYPWYGRGYVQLTWEANYTRMGERLGLDLTTDPDVVMRPDIAVQILVIGCREGLFTGKKLSDYITLQRSNYRGARRVVNGMDKANAIAELAREYETELEAMGYGVEEPAPVVNERRDGTQPRETIAKSKTVQAQAVQWAGVAGPGAFAWFQAEDQIVKLAILGGLVLVLVAGVIVFRERIKKWTGGVR